MSEQMLELEPFQETLGAGMCGAASLLIVLKYYGMERTESELARLLGVDSSTGTDAAALKRVAEDLGFVVEVRNESTLEMVEDWIERGVPVIVDWFTRGRADYGDGAVADGHYSVVAGLDAEHIYLMDPELGKVRRLARGDFLRVWFDFAGEYIKPDGLIVRQTIAIHK